MAALSMQARRREAFAPRKAARAELGPLAQLLTDAFMDDPVLQWTLREGRAFPTALRRYFDFALAEQCVASDLMYVSGADMRATAIWLPPSDLGVLATPPREMLRLIPRFLPILGISRLHRAMSLAMAMDAEHPHEPHWYLYFLGVPPAEQGKGLGSAMMEATLPMVDAERLPAYLDNSNARNIPLYERYGFHVISEYRAREDAPPIWGMWRDARLV